MAESSPSLLIGEFMNFLLVATALYGLLCYAVLLISINPFNSDVWDSPTSFISEPYSILGISLLCGVTALYLFKNRLRLSHRAMNLILYAPFYSLLVVPLLCTMLAFLFSSIASDETAARRHLRRGLAILGLGWFCIMAFVYRMVWQKVYVKASRPYFKEGEKGGGCM